MSSNSSRPARVASPRISIGGLFGWLARLGASGAEENARQAVESAARADRLFADLDERAQRNGWAHQVHFGATVDADEDGAFFTEADQDAVTRSA